MRATDSLDVEFIAEPIVEIDTASTLRERSVELVVNAPKELTEQNLSITLSGDDAGPQLRHRISGSQFTWTREGERMQGRITLELDRPAIIKCRAIYGGALHDVRQLLDEHALPNPRRRVVELTDPGLTNLAQLLLDPGLARARDFEAAVCTLFYLLGFDSVRSGVTNAADVVAIADEEVFMVEATVLVLDPKDKLSKLIYRVEQARSLLRETMRVRGVLAIPLDDKIEKLWRLAAENGLLLLNRAALAESLDRTRRVPQPAETLARWNQLNLREPVG